jgi:gluconolactonase
MTAAVYPILISAVRDTRAELRVLAGGIDHPECVAWFEGRVYCGTESGQVLAIDPGTGETSVVATVGGFTCGLAFDHLGRCWVCDVGQGRVVCLGRDWVVEAAWDEVEGQQLHTPNFPAVARDGTVWIADSGSSFGADDGFLFRIAPGGQAGIVDRSCGRFPNGIALSETEDRLYLVESRLPGVVTYSLAGGTVGARTELLHMPGTVPDGIAFDTTGVLYIACWRPDRVYRLHPGGMVDVYLDDPTAEYMNSPTNVCFGGSDGRRLYVAGLCGWSISQIDVDTPGRVLP